MAVYASRKEFHDSFKRHLRVYRQAVQDGVKQSTHCMMLFYAVECGLKTLIMMKYRLNNSADLKKGRDDEIIPFFKEHNLNDMIKELELGSRYKIPKPDSKNKLDIKDLHSVWRYRDGKYKSQDGTDKTLSDAEQKLDEISKEIEVRLGE